MFAFEDAWLFLVMLFTFSCLSFTLDKCCYKFPWLQLLSPTSCDFYDCYSVYALSHFTISPGWKKIAWNFLIPWILAQTDFEQNILPSFLLFFRISLGGEWVPAYMKREVFSFECCLSIMLCSQVSKCSRRVVCVLLVIFETIYMNYSNFTTLRRTRL